MAFARYYPNAKAVLYSSVERRNSVSSSSSFALAVMAQALLICTSPELVMLAEKIDRLFNKGDKLNLGLAALVLISATYVCFWAQYGPLMNSLGINLALGSCQLGSLYVAVACLRKLHESDEKSVL